MGNWKGQTASRLGKSIVTALSGATQFTTPFSAQTYQVRAVHNQTGGVWATIGSTQVVTANSSATLLPAGVPEYFAVTSGQVLNFISTSTSTTSFLIHTEMT